MSKTSLDKSKIKFLLLEGVHQSAVDVLKSAGYTSIEYITSSLPEAQLKEKIADAHFIGIRSRTQLTEEIFDHAKKLVAVGCFCIGTNQVDLNAARERGIAVFNAPYSNTRSVAELVLAEAILLLRGIPEKNASCHRGGWIKSAANSFEIRGKKLGIVGYGSIGTQLSVLAEGLGMQVFFYDTVTKLPLGNATQVNNLHELLGMSDIVTLHVPETAATQWMIGEKEIRAIKKGGILINAARGTVVKLDALAEAIKDKHLIGAAIDVFPVEPRSNDDIFESPLRGLDNVILTPHIGGSTAEAQANIGLEVAEKLVAVGCFCIGTNQVDLNAARERGIAVFNAPYSNTRSVAELVLAEAILLLRGIPEKNASCHRGGKWRSRGVIRLHEPDSRREPDRPYLSLIHI